MSLLKDLENRSIFLLREAYREINSLAMLWSIGKDSTVLLWLARKAFLGKVPFPLVHIDTGFKLPEMISFRDQLVKDWGLDLIYGMNTDAIKSGDTYPDGTLTRLECCRKLKTQPLKETLSGSAPRYRWNAQSATYQRETKPVAFGGVIVGVRADEEGSRSKERYFSVRNKENKWDIRTPSAELWHYQAPVAKEAHVRVHPILDWTEIDIWRYIELENIPVTNLYFDRGQGKRYRSLGCGPCTGKIDSRAKSPKEVVEELTHGHLSSIPERSDRAQDKEDGNGLETLRVDGYM